MWHDEGWTRKGLFQESAAHDLTLESGLCLTYDLWPQMKLLWPQVEP